MTKYPIPQHQNSNRHHLIEVIKAYPLATIISVNNGSSLISHIPLIYRESDHKLIGHIDVYNPQTKFMTDNNPVTIIFSGPQCYISPSIYTTTQLPTWNYIKVHLKGVVKAIKSTEALRTSLIKMTDFFEQPDNSFTLEYDNPKMEAGLNYIKMFEITVTEWEGKFKLSQDKHMRDRKAAKQELIRANKQDINPFLKKVF
ncbi:FMN-binding negative transcriptional regulator [Flavobacteriaceae bacterium]|nr:FMN-binding negative transcriptional regulator [Flavobacteriaceae bacterium]MDC1051885.1 FMN-binding negative transcriptional regulator [Flavobacteriaceae bacterium]